MIDPKELRIDNLIRNPDGEIIRVTVNLILELQKRKGEMLMRNPPPILFFEPITISEEWLIKCGFENKSKPDCWIFYKEIPFGRLAIAGLKKNKGFSLHEIHGFNEDGEFGKNSHVIALHPIKYLHQLQNRYFDLSGTELTIKL